MPSEVGSGQVAIVPSFRGFRKAVSAEVDDTSSAASKTFTAGFRTTGTSSGKAFGSSFSSSSSAGLKSAQVEVAKTAQALSAARLKEQNAAGNVRVAEAALAAARSKNASDSVQVIRAEERLASAERSLQSAQESVTTTTNRLSAAKLSSAEAAAAAVGPTNRLTSSFSSAGIEGGKKFLTGFGNVLGGVLGANILTGVGFAVGRGISDVISTGINTGLKSISLASDLNETTSAVTTVFGAAAPAIVSFSKTADRALGQTQQQALLGAQSFGVFGKAAGLQGDKLSGFSTGLVTLAGDLASFYNTTPDDAITAISAGLRGESEPLRRYGVLLDDASLRQEALRQGIVKTTKDALTPQQRVLAAQALILQQTGIAQGDFARTSGGLANQQRILTASVQDSEAKLGTFLLPAFASFVNYANTSIFPTLDSAIDRFGVKLGPALDAAKPSVKQLLDGVGPLVDKFGDFAVDALPATIEGLKNFNKIASGALDLFDDIAKASPKADKQQAEFRKNNPFSLDNPDNVIEPLLNPKNVAPKAANSGFDAGDKWAHAFDQGVTSGSASVWDTSLKLGLGASTNVGLGVTAGTPGAVMKVKDLLNGVKTAVPTDGKGTFFVAGQDTAQGFADGIQSKIQTVVDVVNSLGDQSAKALKSKLKINSPSRVTRGLGQYTGDGYALGILDRTAQVRDAASQLAVASLVPVGANAGGAGAGGGGLPDKIMLVDSNGSLLALMDVKVADASAARKTALSTGQQKAAF